MPTLAQIIGEDKSFRLNQIRDRAREENALTAMRKRYLDGRHPYAGLGNTPWLKEVWEKACGPFGIKKQAEDIAACG